VTKSVNKYITDKGLKHPDNGRQIILDDKLKDLLAPPADVQVTYLNLQKYLSVLTTSRRRRRLKKYNTYVT
jgi:chromatin remodeling complex protein RSC6